MSSCNRRCPSLSRQSAAVPYACLSLRLSFSVFPTAFANHWWLELLNVWRTLGSRSRRTQLSNTLQFSRTDTSHVGVFSLFCPFPLFVFLLLSGVAGIISKLGADYLSLLVADFAAGTAAIAAIDCCELVVRLAHYISSYQRQLFKCPGVFQAINCDCERTSTCQHLSISVLCAAWVESLQCWWKGKWGEKVKYSEVTEERTRKIRVKGGWKGNYHWQGWTRKRRQQCTLSSTKLVTASGFSSSKGNKVAFKTVAKKSQHVLTSQHTAKHTQTHRHTHTDTHTVSRTSSGTHLNGSRKGKSRKSSRKKGNFLPVVGGCQCRLVSSAESRVHNWLQQWHCHHCCCCNQLWLTVEEQGREEWWYPMPPRQEPFTLQQPKKLQLIFGTAHMLLQATFFLQRLQPTHGSNSGNNGNNGNNIRRVCRRLLRELSPLSPVLSLSFSFFFLCPSCPSCPLGN